MALVGLTDQHIFSNKRFAALFQKAVDVSGAPKFGLKYPKKYELIWADPGKFQSRINHKKMIDGLHPQGYRMRVICSGEWDRHTTPLTIDYLMKNTPKFIGLRERIIDSKPWERTKLYEASFLALERNGSVDGITTRDDLLKRFSAIDKIIEDVIKEGRLRTRQELDPLEFRERGGTPLLIDRRGEFVLGRGGSHRFFISLILRVKLMPVSLVAVHPASSERFVSVRQASEELKQEHVKGPPL